MFATAGLSELGARDLLFIAGVVVALPLLGVVAVYYLISAGHKVWRRSRRNNHEHKEI